MWKQDQYIKSLVPQVDFEHHIHVSPIIGTAAVFCMADFVDLFVRTDHAVNTIDLVQASIAVNRYMDFPCLCDRCIKLMIDPLMLEVGVDIMTLVTQEAVKKSGIL